MTSYRPLTKTQAADIIADDMRVFARAHNLDLTLSLAEARVSEYRGTAYGDVLKHRAALSANPKTVLRIALSRGAL